MDWVLDLRHEALTPVVTVLTFLGDPMLLIVLLVLGYWLIDRDGCRRLIILVLMSLMLNAALKGFFQVPRPGIPHLVPATGWAFPSGHAQTAAVFWAGLALERRWRRAWPLAALAVVGVAASRVYLGVHYPVDVVCGVAIGLVTVAVAGWLVRHPPAWRVPDHLAAGAIAAGVIAWLLVPPGGEAGGTALGGILVGFWIAERYQRRWLDFAVPRIGWQRLVVALLGLAVAVGLRSGLAAALAELPAGIADFTCHGLIGAWIGGVGPWVFVRLSRSCPWRWPLRR